MWFHIKMLPNFVKARLPRATAWLAVLPNSSRSFWGQTERMIGLALLKMARRALSEEELARPFEMAFSPVSSSSEEEEEEMAVAIYMKDEAGETGEELPAKLGGNSFAPDQIEVDGELVLTSNLDMLYNASPKVFAEAIGRFVAMVKTQMEQSSRPRYPYMRPHPDSGWLIFTVSRTPAPELAHIPLDDPARLAALFFGGSGVSPEEGREERGEKEEKEEEVEVAPIPHELAGGRTVYQYLLDDVGQLHQLLSQDHYVSYIIPDSSVGLNVLLLPSQNYNDTQAKKAPVKKGEDEQQLIKADNGIWYPPRLHPKANYANLYTYLNSVSDSEGLQLLEEAVALGKSQKKQTDPERQPLLYLGTEKGWIAVKVNSLAKMSKSVVEPVVRKLLGAEKGEVILGAAKKGPVAPERPLPKAPPSLTARWSVTQRARRSGNEIIYGFARQEAGSTKIIKWKAVLDQAATGAVIPLLVETLKAVEFDNYYWECRGVSAQSSAETNFEFVVTRAKPNAPEANADIYRPLILAALKSHAGRVIPEVIISHQEGETLLLPLPPRPEDRGQQNNASLASFVRTGNPAVVISYLTLVFAELKRQVEAKPRQSWWLSTRPEPADQWLALRITGPDAPTDYHAATMAAAPVEAASSSAVPPPPTPIRSTFSVTENNSRFSRISQTGVVYKEPAIPKLGIPKTTSKLAHVAGIKSLNFLAIDASLEPHPFIVHHGKAVSSTRRK